MPESDAVVQIISRLGVDYSQAIVSTRMLADATAQLDRQLRGLKITVADLARATNRDLSAQLAQMAGGKVIYDQYGRAISIVGTGIEDIARKTKDATRVAREHIKTVKDLEREYNVLGSQFERRVSWFVAGAGFFGSLEAIRQAATTISEVEAGMTTIARVTEDVTFNYKDVRDQLLRMGVEYGMTWDKVSDIMTRWVQAGYSVSESLELTRTSLLALNTAELDANYATQGLIAIMAQWGLTADQLLPTIDKINKVADDFAVTSQDLVDGLMRSSGAAKVLGLSLDETIAILTVMREATGRTGKEVGNALNSILSFMQRPIAIKAFEAEGINIWADAAKTQFRSVIEIFEEVARRWPQMGEASRDMFVQAAEQAGLYSEELAELAGLQKEFNDLQQRDISQAMAGIYRRNYLLALLQNWAKIDQVLISMEKSLGYSMRENERTMQTLAKQWESLKAVAQELAVALGDAGLLEQLKELVEGAKDAVTWFNELDPTLRKLIFSFVELTVAMKVLGAVFKMAGISGMVSIFSGWAVPIAAATTATRGMATTLTLLGTVARNVGLGISALFGGPVALAIIAAGTALTAFVSSAKDARKEHEEFTRAMYDVQGKLEEYQQTLESAPEGSEQYQNALKQQSDLLQDIGIRYPELVKKTNEYGKVVEVDQEKISQLAKEYEKLSKSQKKVVDSYKESMQASNQRILELEKEAGRIESSANTLRDLVNYYRNYQQVAGDSAEKSKEMAKIEEGIAAIIGTAGLERLKAAGFTEKAVQQEIEAIKKAAQAKRQEVLEEKKRQIEMTKNTIEETKKRIKALQAEIAALEAGTPLRWQQTLKAWGEAFIKTFPLPDPFLFMENYHAALDKMAQEMESSLHKAGKQLEEKLKELDDLNKEYADTIAQQIDETEKQNTAFANQEEILKRLNDALEEHLHTVERMLKTYQDLVAETEALLDINRAQYEFYSREGAPLEDRVKAVKLQAEAIGLLLTKQDDLHSLAEANRRALSDLKTAGVDLGKGITATASSIGKLSGSLEDYFISASRATGVSVDLLKAVAKVESGFNQAARSSAGAIGIMQLMPGTARGLGVDPYDLGQNILGGAKYLQQALNAFNGNLQLALAAYNAGIGAVQRAIQKAGSETWENVKKYLPKETQAYVPKVLSNLGSVSGVVAGEQKISDELQKEYERRQQIQEQYADATINMYQEIYRAQADWWRSQKEISDLTISGLEYVRTMRQQQIDSLKNEIEYLTRDGASQEELNRAYILNARYIDLLNEKRTELLNKIRAEQEFIAAIKQEQASLNTSTKEGAYQYALYNKAIADASQRIVELNREMIELNRTMNEAINMPYQHYFNNLMAWMQHMENIGRLTVAQQLEILKGIDLQRLALQDQWRVQEDIYRRRRQALQEEMDAIREAYDERMRQIEKEIEADQKRIEIKEKEIEAIEATTNAQIEAIKKLIEALDIEDEQSNREEAERQHNQKLAKLREEYQYHALRTGLEHQRRMAEILEEIAEEEHRWELQKQEWARQDQRKAYQQQIEALREQAKARQDAIRQEINDLQKASDQKKKELQEYYDEIQRMFNDAHLNMLASLSLYEDKYYDAVKRIMDKIRQAIEEGNIELIPGLLDEAKDTIDEAEETERSRPREEPPTPPREPVAVFGPSDYTERGGRAYAWAKTIGNKLGLPVTWDAQKKIVTIGGKSFFPDFIEKDKAYLALRTVGQAFGYDVDYTNKYVSFLPKAHTGAYVVESGIAELLKGERVLSPQLTVSFDRLANVLANFPNIPERISLMQQGYGNLDRLADRIIAAIERRKGIHIERLFNAETVELADRTDMEILSRELARAVNMLQTARG
jgi:soluble lytic murein transglycosylase-like protein